MGRFLMTMNTNEISGKRQMEFLAGFDYIREAGTAGEEKAAALLLETLSSLGVESRLEEFGFDTFQGKADNYKTVQKGIHSDWIRQMRQHGRGWTAGAVCLCREW